MEPKRTSDNTGPAWATQTPWGPPGADGSSDPAAGDLSGGWPSAPPAAPMAQGPSTVAPGPTPSDAAPGTNERASAVGSEPFAEGPTGSLLDQVGRVLVGDTTSLPVAVSAFLAGGHVLLEDMPGVGKTLLAKALARSIGGTFGRVQGTPDLLPSDLTGVSVYDQRDRSWQFNPGPLFHNVVLVDELNRTTPRTQSALLEAMAERQVTVDGITHALPDPFFVVATQNPHDELLGTFPLVAGQRDRFAVSMSLGLPGRAAERGLLLGHGGEADLGSLRPAADLDTWRQMRHHLDEVHLADSVAEYLLDIIDSIRRNTGGEQFLSPRASLALLGVARAHATVFGRRLVLPDDVRAVAVAALAHRLVDLTDGSLPLARGWVQSHVAAVPPPPVLAS